VSGGAYADNDADLWDYGHATADFNFKVLLSWTDLGKILDYEGQVRDRRGYEKALQEALKGNQKWKRVLFQILKYKLKEFLSADKWDFLREELGSAYSRPNFEWDVPTGEWGDDNGPSDFDLAEEPELDTTVRLVGGGIEVLAETEVELDHK